jgi:hypothetical protein
MHRKNQVSIYKLGYSKEDLDKLMAMLPKLRSSKSKVGTRRVKVSQSK